MTLEDLGKAIEALIEQGIDKDEHVFIQVDEDKCFELNAITVIVQSDHWVPETVVVTGIPVVYEGEADDG